MEEQGSAGGAERQIAKLVEDDEIGVGEPGGDLSRFAPGGALLFHLLSKLYERASVIITTNLSFGEWGGLRPPLFVVTEHLGRHPYLMFLRAFLPGRYA